MIDKNLTINQLMGRQVTVFNRYLFAVPVVGYVMGDNEAHDDSLFIVFGADQPSNAYKKNGFFFKESCELVTEIQTERETVDSEIIKALKESFAKFGSLTISNQAILELAGKDNCQILMDNGFWERIKVSVGPFDEDNRYRLRSDYEAPKPKHSNRVFASTGDTDSGANNIVGVTAHCECGNVFTDDVAHCKPKGIVDVRSSQPEAPEEKPETVDKTVESVEIQEETRAIAYKACFTKRAALVNRISGLAVWSEKWHDLMKEINELTSAIKALKV